ncbi:hypothetical protein AJ87_12295 [Rhizobium yanglingense]|nr:hypothetical protein AJ87_12295 [Rhizobium yanglingense]
MRRRLHRRRGPPQPAARRPDRACLCHRRPRSGKVDGAIVGTLGVYFDWQNQGQAIVDKEANLPPQVAEKTTVMLLDGASRIIAASNPALLFTHFALQNQTGQSRGSYYDNNGSIVAFARTLGYEDYDGLGWHGVVVQRTEDDAAIRAALNLR